MALRPTRPHIALIVALSSLLLPPGGGTNGVAASQLARVQAILRGLGVKPPARTLHHGKVADPLYARYLLATGKRQKASLRFGDGSIMYLNNRTDVELRDPFTSIVRAGEVDQADARGTHRILTATASVTALGTNLDVKIVRGVVFVTVVSGRVSVRNAGARVLVGKNQQTVVRRRRPPSGPRRVNARKIIAWTNDFDSDGWIDITPPRGRFGLPQLSGPSGVAVGPDGGVYVLDGSSGSVKVFARDGRLIRSWDVAGEGGIAVSGAGTVYVASADGVYTFTADGKPLRLITGPLDVLNQATLGGADDIAVDAQGTMYLSMPSDVSGGKSTVVVASAAGDVLARWSTPRSGVLPRLPRGIALDAQGNVYVANGTVVKLSPSGRVLARWRFSSDGPSQATDVAVDRRGQVFVSAQGARYPGEVYWLSPAGRVQRVWGERRDYTRDGRFYLPGAIAVDPKGSLYVADTGNKRIEMLPYFAR